MLIGEVTCSRIHSPSSSHRGAQLMAFSLTGLSGTVRLINEHLAKLLNTTVWRINEPLAKSLKTSSSSCLWLSNGACE